MSLFSKPLYLASMLLALWAIFYIVDYNFHPAASTALVISMRTALLGM